MYCLFSKVIVTGIRDGHFFVCLDGSLRHENGGPTKDVCACIRHARMIHHSQSAVKKDGIVSQIRIMYIKHVGQKLYQTSHQ